jgi:surfactin synthase thioesterase subunit
MKIRLFCFPYAGGSSLIYRKWEQYLAPGIELVPVELASRGVRIQEELYQDINAAVEDVFTKIKRDITRAPYALFGHSMGALICYKLAQKIRKEKLPQPEHIFFSGRNAPHLKRRDDQKYHLMSNEDFKASVLKLGGTPPELFDHPEFLEIFLPILRNDFRLSEMSGHEEAIDPLDDPITILTGKDDHMIQEHEEWEKHTSKSCRILFFEGGHFFLNEATEPIVRFVNQTLTRKLYQGV